MSECTYKRISIKHLKIDMEIAEDAVTHNGHVLIPKNTVITENHIFRMNLYQILSVVIKDYDQNNTYDSPLHIFNDEVDFINNQLKTEDFQRFNQIYKKVEFTIKNQFLALGKGKEVNLEILVATIETLFNSLRHKSDLFTYMSYLLAEDNFTYIHSINVAMLCNIFGQWLKMSDFDIKELTLAALIHDIGKTKIDPALLGPAGQLSDYELENLRQHSKIGYDIIKNQPISDRIKSAILMHHERNDGTGYPLGLKDKDIPDFAKIIAIVDVYEAMTSSRIYQKKFSPFKVIQIFEQDSFGHLDTHYLFTFLKNIAHYYLGQHALLSDGTEVKIVFIHTDSPSKPIVQSDHETIDLRLNHDLYIEDIL